MKPLHLNRYRWLLMLLAPGPIVAGSIALSRLARSERPAPPATNDVLVRGQEPEQMRDAPPLSGVWPMNPALEDACRAREAAILSALGEPCQCLVAAPFVIAGDLSAEELAHWHAQTIQPAARAMALRYFETPPDEPITVLLLRSKESYEHYADKLYRDRGISIYGYYKPRERTLVMNIATGAGTLVHELTHALVAFDCERVPDWFNEGLSSLHEQCRFRDDARGPWIEGLVNWRLTRLQAEVAAGRLIPLQTFVRDDDFRGEREAVNYAQARYVCLFMQEQGVLELFYTQLKANIKRDPYGEVALREVFPNYSHAELNAAFAEFVKQLPAQE
ncbi:MAG TPA: hypothetical protein VL096_10775 [Pirellulaceae bacterium]|nr:hypothetical protein [Pirellulaceae bacterium]